MIRLVTRIVRWTLVCLLGLGSVGALAETGSPADIDFNKRIRPVLADKCFACHGRDENAREADLRLDTKDGALADLGGTRAIVPGKLDESELWARINSTDEDLQMPPPDTKKSVSPEERELLKAWISAGAPYKEHWSFAAPKTVELPKADGAIAVGANPIDAFVVRALSAEGMAWSPEADRRTLIRRVAFATTGLPPTTEEVTAYVADKKSGAYERMLDGYLASPQYGEEMARHWLDLARYADTHGMHLDNERHMWAYRDWVVKSFNDNLPFDEFTVAQIAGDLLESPTQEQMVATGFNRCNVTTGEGGSIKTELLYRYAVERAATTVQTWAGLTAGCAACHDHKFDPISQKEFYSLYAFFNSAADPAMDGNKVDTPPIIKLETAADRDKLADIAMQIAAKQREMDELATKLEYEDPAEDETLKNKVVRDEQIWMDEAFPEAGTLHGNPTFVGSNDGQVFAGKLALKRTGKGTVQDVWEKATTPLTIPNNAKIFAHVWLDAKDPAKTVMLQFYKDGWLHRAVWGEYDSIPWGKEGSFEKVNMGALPKLGEWVRLEVPAAKLGLAAGDALTGFALTQYDGTVYWDKVGVDGNTSPASDPRQSLLAWWQQAKGQDGANLPASIKEVAKKGPNDKVPAAKLKELRKYYLQNICKTTSKSFGDVRSSIAELKKSKEAIKKSQATTFVFKDLDKPRDSFVMMRGAYDKPGEKVTPDVPAIFPPVKKTGPDGRATRLDLARWFVSAEHPLTARVAVNRFWQQLFGTGLVATSDDFGTQGELPSHPELLDWLALEYQRIGWDTRALMRMMLSSKTFRQSSVIPASSASRDPKNRMLSHFPRLRLDAEQIRDNALFVSGLLDASVGGKGVRPYQPDNIWEPVGFAGSNTRFYKRDSGAALYRRSLYVFYKRTAPPPFMSNFDAPNREQFCSRRSRSNTPLQALQLMNDVQHVEAARSLAQRMLLEGGDDDGARLEFGFQTVLARSPEAAEVAIAVEQLKLHRQRYARRADDAKKLIEQGESKPDDSIAADELAAYTLVANMILNLDETLTRN